MKRRALCSLLIAAPAAAGAYLAESIERLLAASPAAHTAFWGIQVVDLATGKTLYELNRDHFFVPASNTKLFTTALALTRLGPDFTFRDARAGRRRARRRRAHSRARSAWSAAAIRTSRRAPIPYRTGPSPAIRWSPSRIWPTRSRRAA